MLLVIPWILVTALCIVVFGAWMREEKVRVEEVEAVMGSSMRPISMIAFLVGPSPVVSVSQTMMGRVEAEGGGLIVVFDIAMSEVWNGIVHSLCWGWMFAWDSERDRVM